VHRDVKPDNILLVDGVAKLADFGTVVAPGKTPASRIGTLGFASPNQLSAYRNDPTWQAFKEGTLSINHVANALTAPNLHTDRSYIAVESDDIFSLAVTLNVALSAWALKITHQPVETQYRTNLLLRRDREDPKFFVLNQSVYSVYKDRGTTALSPKDEQLL